MANTAKQNLRHMCKHTKNTIIQWNRENESAIAIRPSRNEQGGNYFISLNIGKRILRNHWTKLPMTNDVVNAIHRLVATQKGGITFTDKDSNIIADDDDKEME